MKCGPPNQQWQVNNAWPSNHIPRRHADKSPRRMGPIITCRQGYVYDQPERPPITIQRNFVQSGSSHTGCKTCAVLPIVVKHQENAQGHKHVQLSKKGKNVLRELMVKMWLRLCVFACDGISCRLKFPSTSNTPDKGRAKQLSKYVMCCPSTCCHCMRIPFGCQMSAGAVRTFPPKRRWVLHWVSDMF